MALFCLFLRKMPLFHYLNHYKVAKNDPLTLKCGLKLALISFFKNQLGIFDFDCHRKVGSAQNTTFWIKSGAQRMRRDANTVQREENRIPDLKRGENFLSNSIQYIYIYIG